MNNSFESLKEFINNDTYRIKVYGGWMVVHDPFTSHSEMGAVFVPDPQHEWQLPEIIQDI